MSEDKTRNEAEAKTWLGKAFQLEDPKKMVKLLEEIRDLTKQHYATLKPHFRRYAFSSGIEITPK